MGNKPWLNSSGYPDPTAYIAMKNIQKERRLKMTALEYMKKQVCKHTDSYFRAMKRGAPDYELQNIKKKIGYYEAAVNALKKGGADNE